MKKILSIVVILFVVFMVIAMIFQTAPFLFLPSEQEDTNQESNSSTTIVSSNQNNNFKNMAENNKKILMVVAFRDFKDEEYFIPKKILEKNGFFVEAISDQKGTAMSVDGQKIEIQKTPYEINPKDYAGVIFVGGPGMGERLDNVDFQDLAREFYGQGKLVSAICLAPALLAKTGILNGKKATVWSSEVDKSALEILTENGAIYQEASVVRDGNLITADGPQSADDFAQTIIDYLSNN
jgi:protease I